MLQYQTLELRNLTQESKNVRLKVNNFIESQKRKIKRMAENKIKQSRLIEFFLKGVHPMIFVLNIFPNLHLNQMRIRKNIRHKDDRMKSLYIKCT